MKNLSILLMSAFVVILSSCTKVVDLKLSEPESKIAVEGMISNQAGGSFVRLAYTKGYLSSDARETIVDAQVSVRDNEGKLTLFSASDQKGTYLPPAGFIGEAGKTYSLNVQYKGGHVSAQSTMSDTVSGSGVHMVKADITNPHLAAGYHLMATIKKYKAEDSYMKAEVFINGKKRMTTADDIVVFEDLLFEKNDELEGSLAFWEESMEEHKKPKVGDVVKLQLISINKETFEYLRALSETPTQGGLFGKTPANVPSNITGGLGWFQASSASLAGEIIVAE
jgi:hypothetical protein